MPRGDLDKVTNELTKIQKRAAILISGAFRGTAGAALDTELFITPIKLRIQQIVEETAIRILTGPQWACPQTTKEPRKLTQRRLGGWSPTEAIAQKKPLRLLLGEKWEEKQAFVLAPWEAPIPCFIENQEAALETHNDIYEGAVCNTDSGRKTDMLFTDGSGFAGHIGASTASLIHGVISQRRYLGTDSQSTVYAAELSGIEMALAKTKTDNEGQAREVIIFSDSQAAIQAVQNPQRPSGQYVLTHIYNHVRAIRSNSQPTNITIRWIPAHVGVDGNEFADEAKGAALLGAGMGVATGTDEPIIRLAAAAKRATHPDAVSAARYAAYKIVGAIVGYWDQRDGLRQDVSNPQATRYVVNFMHRTGLLQQFQHVGIEEENDDDEPTGLAAMDLGVEDDGY
ncbi:hypothetical protein VN97_g12967 [Penicillium thymicola]|uniref:RNase H type-1 domain-containing protein n=1 Tax=Penicillium thymicola TaxID=293382 RepID=A0AAI9X1P0_PENTH|nr:hypothetical protein VN97_g12967 [Penicillium thymicola]